MTVSVAVPAPGAAIVSGVSVTVWEAPPPLTLKVSFASNPPETVVVIVEVPVLPSVRLSCAGDALMLNVTAVPVTVSITVVKVVALPAVPVTVM